MWSLVLQPYTFEIQHRKGRDNANAYALSWLPQELCFTLKKEGSNVTNGTLDAQQMDQAIQVELADYSCDESEICDEKQTNQNMQETRQSKYTRNRPIITGQLEYKKGRGDCEDRLEFKQRRGF